VRGASAIDPAAFERLVAEHMALSPEFRWNVVELAHGFSRVRLEYDGAFVRAGGTVSGPTMFALADLTLYAAVLSVVGLVPLAVTSEMAIHFLRRPPPVPMIATAEILKAGSKLVHGDVRIYSEGDDAAVCHATGTYAVPGSKAQRGE
jgi:uncharacterized protein (TIGR00369 family)